MMPQMQDALNGWEEKITLVKLVNTNDDDGILVTIEIPLTFMGTIQPLKPTELQVSSSGQRKFEWWQVHTRFKLHDVVNPSERVRFKGKVYKVMLQNDYNRNGYIEYHLIQYVNNG
jgi:hypothetical protein